MRILGLDYGDSRIGVALSDETGIIATGLTTLVRKSREKDLRALAAMIETHKAEKLVVGLPLRLDGTEGIQCEKVRHFARLLDKAFHLPVVLWEESFSTKDAEAFMAEARVKSHKRRAIVDRIAASIILQSYLDAGLNKTEIFINELNDGTEKTRPA